MDAVSPLKGPKALRTFSPGLAAHCAIAPDENKTHRQATRLRTALFGCEPCIDITFLF
jgi:hypothetical protein